LEIRLGHKFKRLVALDTKDSEDAAYYGTAFIDGSAIKDLPMVYL
jgi:hypothetical protein